VYLCTNKETGIARAVKIIRKSELNEAEQNRLQDEANILKLLDHPNIVRLYEIYNDPKRYYMVTEYFFIYEYEDNLYRLCTGGELFDRLADEKYFSEQHAARIMKQVLSALAYCHNCKIVHRDMKPNNLLLATPDKDTRIKIIDFGTSMVFNPGKKITGKIGTPLFIAPEVLRGSYTEKCDVWSCGVLLYVLLSGTQPFHGSSSFDVMQKIKRGTYTMLGTRWEAVSTKGKDLVKLMLQYDPEKRCSALEALNHPWILHFTENVLNTESAKILLNDLRTFSAECKLQQAALTYIVSQLVTNKEKEALQSVFLKLDKDKDGRLGQQELIDGFKEIFGENYPAEEEVKNILTKIDIDNNGYIDLTEFIIATMNKKKLLSQERLISAFKMFDRVYFLFDI